MKEKSVFLVLRLFKKLAGALLAFAAVTSNYGGWDLNFETNFPSGYEARCVTTVTTNVYVGTAEGQVLKWNSGGGWSIFTPDWVDGAINFIAYWNGALYVGGDFIEGYSGANWITFNKVSKVNLSTGVFTALGSGITGTIYTMVIPANESAYRGDFLYVGGYITAAGGNTASHIAAWNGRTGTISKAV